MWVLLLGLVVFFRIHSVRMVAAGFRQAQLGANQGRWKGIYSLLSLVGLVLIIWGWMLYRPEAPHVFEPPSWGRHAAMLLVLLAFILLASSNMPAGYIKSVTRHPMLTGVALWAFGHLLANGDLASLLLFGSFLLYAIVNRVAVAGRNEPAPTLVKPRSDLIAIVSGTALYLLFVFWLHGFLFGVSPLA